jgi:oxygen-independent coproporphyrinogen-3 oxidase
MRRALRSYVVEDDAGRAAPLSLYVHVPFCQERCLYCGCNVVIAPRDKVSDPYMDALHREMQMVRGELGKRRPVTQLHLGGGTPTYLQPAQLEELMRWMHECFAFEANAEISIEVDPVVTTDEHLHALRKIGFNRISMGVQDLDPRVQETVHRVQPKALTERFYGLCRELGFDSVNMDLIYGLPHQSVESFAATVDHVIRWRPDRIAVFNYAHVPWIKPHQNRMPADALPPPDEKLAIFLDTSRRFGEAGYVAIGLDHFAVPEDELAQARLHETLRRNFMGYTTQPETESLGFGVTSISEIQGTYVQNLTRLSEYERRVNGGELPAHRGMQMSSDDKLRNDVIMDIMCNFVLDKGRIEEKHGIVFDELFAQTLEPLREMERDGLIRLPEGRIEVTEMGQVLVRNVAMLFDAYLDRPTEGGRKPIYSRTV